MKITPKQEELINAYKSGKFMVFALGGGAGSAKTIGILILIHYLCKNFNGIRIGIFRKSEKNLKQNTIPSYRKMLKLYGDSILIKDMEARYPNGSIILFNWADISKDPDCDNIKGGEYTIIFFNEANQIHRNYYEVAKTRVGRWNDIDLEDGQGKLKPGIFLDFNPNNEWPKDEFYDKYAEGKLPSKTFFQLSLPIDNPFLDNHYLEMLRSLHKEMYDRYYLGKWDYADDPAQLITYEWYKNCMQDEIELDEGYEVMLAVDPKDEGKDKSVFAFMKKNKLFRIEEYTRQNEIEAAHMIEERMNEHGIKGHNVIVDTIGVGAGTGNYLRERGHHIFKFVSGEKSEVEHPFYEFKNLRAEAGWLLRQAMQNEEIELIHSTELQRQLLAIRYLTDGKTIQIEKKMDIRKRLGYSPDYYDAVAMVNYLRLKNEGAVDFDKLASNPDRYVEFDDPFEKYREL